MKYLKNTLSNIESYLKWLLILTAFKSLGADSVDAVSKIIAYFARDGDIYSVNYKSDTHRNLLISYSNNEYG